MPHNPASIVRLLYGEHYRRKNRAEAFSLNPATNSLTFAVPIGQGQSMLRSRLPDLVVDLLPFEIVAQSITSLRRQTIGNPRSVLPRSPFLDNFLFADYAPRTPLTQPQKPPSGTVDMRLQLSYFAMQSLNRMNSLNKALSDISSIRRQVAHSTEFRGYGPATLASTGILAFAAAGAQALRLPDPANHMPTNTSNWFVVAGVAARVSA